VTPSRRFPSVRGREGFKKLPFLTKKEANKISISLELEVLRAAGALARKRGAKRLELIARYVVAGVK
jgi:hypothetical protein